VNNDAIKYFNSFYHELSSAVQVFDSSGKLVFVNKTFSAVWGYSMDELKEYNLFNDSIVKKSSHAENISKSFEQSIPLEIKDYSDSLLNRKRTAVPLFLTKLFAVRFDNETYHVFVHEDRTETFLAEEEVKKAREASKEADRLKNTFLNVLSHELRTPLNIILGYSTIIKDSLKDKVSTEEKVYLDNLYNGSERLFKTISQMLEFAQLDAGNYKLSFETVDLIPILNYKIQNIKQHALEKKLDLKTVLKEKSILVDVDLHCIENTLGYLLDNAVKFTPHGFIEVEAGIMKEHELAYCKIKDSGVGISADYLEHLYSPFSQEDLNLSRNYEGNGLGLAVSKRYIENLGGSLIVDSIKGVGSTFSITLPLSKKSGKTEVGHTESHFAAIKNILMMDEAGETAELVKIFLKDYAEVTVYKFDKFLKHLSKNESYQLVILDINLNQWQDGLALCREITAKDPFKRPVFIASGETDKHKINEYYQAGAARFLVKPFSKNDITDSLNSILAH
jgi:PAS domain S-box-containing protein